MNIHHGLMVLIRIAQKHPELRDPKDFSSTHGKKTAVDKTLQSINFINPAYYVIAGLLVELPWQLT